MSVELTVPALLADGAERHADHPAVVDGDVRLTYAELNGEARRVARAFLAAGVRHGDRVAVWAPNRVEFVLAHLGAQLIGAALVPLNTRYRGHEARVVLSRSRASALVLCNGFLGVDYVALLADSAESDDELGTGAPIVGLPHLHTVVDIDGGPAAHDDETGVVGWEAFVSAGEDVPEADLTAAIAAVTPDTICDILYTSGTTGVPKGVMSAHRQTIAVARVWADGADLTPADRYAIVNPFFHSFGYKAGALAAFTAGSTVYPILTFDPVEVMAMIERERISVLPGAPTIFLTLINHPRLAEFDLSSLRFATAGAATVPENLFEQMRDILGFDTAVQAYGLTECVVVSQSRKGEDPRHIAETTGPAVPGLEIRAVDADGNDVPMGEDGEIWLRGETVMLGYFEDPGATAAAIDADGWFRTGDVGRLDEHGCLKITDRIKDLFIVGGFNVYPAEVENALAAHPDIVEAAVVGVPDHRMGSVGRAYVVLRDGADLASDAVVSHCKDRLANFKVPRQVVVVDALPRNASGKVLKTDLRHGG